MSKREDCLAIGEEALASFTRDELQDFADQVIERAQSYEDVKGQAAIKRALDELNNEKAKSLFNDCKTIANNVAKVKERVDAIKKGVDIRQQLTPRGKTAQSDNIWAAQRAARGILVESAFKEWDNKLQNFAFNKKNDMDVYSALDGLAASDKGKSIAKGVLNFIKTRNAESVRTDALPLEYISDYRYLDHMHDVSAMVNGGKNFVQTAMNIFKRNAVKIDPKAAWVNTIKSRLDPEDPIHGVKIKSDAHLNDVLENIYDNITQNRNHFSTASLVVNDLEDVRRKRLLKLNFKNWRAFGEYNNIYGHTSLMQSLMADIQSSGARIGMADMLGSSPKHAFLEMGKAQEKAGIPGRFKSSGLYQRNNDFIFQALSGSNQASVAPTISNFFSNIRSFTSMVRLIKLGLLSTPDISHGVSYYGRFGNNMFKDFGYYLTNLWNNPIGKMVHPERKILAKQFKLMIDSHLGHVARSIDANNSTQFINRAVSRVFKMTLLEALDKGNKVSTLHIMANTLGRHSRTAWEHLPDDFRNQIANHNISEDEWNLLRTKTSNQLFTLDNVDKVTDQELRQLKSDSPLLNRRSDLYRKVYALFDNAAQQVVLSPTAWTKGMLYQGTQGGNWLGEIVRQVGQFKMYPVDYIDRVWGQGLNNADGMMGKMAFATRLLATTMPLSYLSMWFDYASQGKTMPDPEQMAVGEKLRFYTSLVAPGMGIFLSVLDPKNQNKNLYWSVFRTPSTDLIGETLATILAASRGDSDQALKDLKHVGKYLTPVDTIPFISPLLREQLGERPYLQKGQQQIYGA